MLYSMTGFGRSEILINLGRVIVEIQSVNRKHFEMQVMIPKEFFKFEHDLRACVSEKVHRGQFVLRMQLVPTSESIAASLPDVEMLRGLQKSWVRIAQELGMDPKQIDLKFLQEYMPAVVRSDCLAEHDLYLLKTAVLQAVDHLLNMREKEGKALAEDVSQRLSLIEQKVKEIESHSFDLSDRLRMKLQEKMKSLWPSDALIDDRIFKEIALYAEKADIAEELTRLKSHFSQFVDCICGKGPQGRKMDFVLQEISREVNTIGSKSSESKISYLVVEIKTEIEKIREQIQNIE